MFRFSIRELMLVTMVVGLTIGWWRDHRDLSHKLSAAKVWQNATGAAEHVLNDLGWKPNGI